MDLGTYVTTFVVLTECLMWTSTHAHICVLKQRLDTSTDRLRWSLPYNERCYCQGVVAASWMSLECPGVHYAKDVGVLWFTDDPSALGLRANWSPETLDVLLERKVFCDKEAPLFTSCPANVTADTSPGEYTAFVEWSDIEAIDNSGLIPPVNCSMASGSLFDIGQTDVACEAFDANGNVATCSFIIDISDKEAPMFTSCPADITAHTSPGESTVYVEWGAIEATDNSGFIPSVTCSFESGSYFAIWQTGPNVCEAVDANGSVVEATNNSGIIPPLNCSLESGSGFVIGQTDVACEAIDANENVATCSFNIDISGNLI